MVRGWVKQYQSKACCRSLLSYILNQGLSRCCDILCNLYVCLYIICLRPCLIRQYFWISAKSGSRKFALYITNTKPKSDFIQKSEKSWSVFLQILWKYGIFPCLLPILFYGQITHCELIKWIVWSFHWHLFIAAHHVESNESGLNKHTRFWNQIRFWPNQTGP